MSKRGVWIPQQMTYIKDDKIKSYRAYICSECNNEQITESNYCSKCGSLNRNNVNDDESFTDYNHKVYSEDCYSCAFLSGRACLPEQPCKKCDNYVDGCNCLKKAPANETTCPFWRSN